MDVYLFQKINPVKDFLSFANLLDIRIFNGVNQFALKWLWLDTLGIFFAQYFEYVLVFFLFLFLMKFKKYWKMVFEAFVSAILARFVVVEFIRWIWQRPRPFFENNVNILLTNNSPSFPSGHATFFFALSTVVFLYNKKLGFLFYVASFLICLARIFAGLHWPTDILVGALIGIFFGWLIKNQGAKLLARSLAP